MFPCASENEVSREAQCPNARHSRERGNPGRHSATSPLGPRLRGDDEQRLSARCTCCRNRGPHRQRQLRARVNEAGRARLARAARPSGAHKAHRVPLAGPSFDSQFSRFSSYLLGILCAGHKGTGCRGRGHMGNPPSNGHSREHQAPVSRRTGGGASAGAGSLSAGRPLRLRGERSWRGRRFQRADVWNIQGTLTVGKR